MTYEELKEISLKCADERAAETNPLGYIAHTLPFTLDNEGLTDGIKIALELIEICGYEVVKKKDGGSQ